MKFSPALAVLLLMACNETLKDDELLLGVTPNQPVSDLKISKFQMGVPNFYPVGLRPYLVANRPIDLKLDYDRGQYDAGFHNPEIASTSFRALNKRICAVMAKFVPFKADNAEEIGQRAVTETISAIEASASGLPAPAKAETLPLESAEFDRQHKALKAQLERKFGPANDGPNNWSKPTKDIFRIELSGYLPSEDGAEKFVETEKGNQIEYVFDERCDIPTQISNVIETDKNWEKLSNSQKMNILEQVSRKQNIWFASVRKKPKA